MLSSIFYVKEAAYKKFHCHLFGFLNVGIDISTESFYSYTEFLGDLTDIPSPKFKTRPIYPYYCICILCFYAQSLSQCLNFWPTQSYKWLFLATTIMSVSVNILSSSIAVASSTIIYVDSVVPSMEPPHSLWLLALLLDS